MPVKRHRAANGRCQASTKGGTRCAAPAVKGTRLCSLHADPERAAEMVYPYIYRGLTEVKRVVRPEEEHVRRLSEDWQTKACLRVSDRSSRRLRPDFFFPQVPSIWNAASQPWR